MARILIAEDDDSMRHFLAKALQRAGHEVIAVSNGGDALPVLGEGGFDLLVADIVMPQMDGIELVQRAAAVDPELRIMFITGFAAVMLNNGRRSDYPAKVLSKPFHLRDLVDEVERVLAGPGGGEVPAVP
jgi:two-component system cell cycle response regulator CpdR